MFRWSLPILTALGLAFVLPSCGGSATSADSGNDGAGGGGGPSPGTGAVGSGAVSNGGMSQTGGALQTGGSMSSGGAPSTIDRSCQTALNCVLVPAECCGGCSAPELDQVVAIRQGSEQQYRTSVCDPDTACVDCETPNNPYLYAECVAGQCQAVDLRSTGAATCQSDDDCRARPGGCCECGGSTEPGQILSVNPERLGRYLDAVCGDMVACPECAWIAPPEVSVTCVEGACDLIDTRVEP